jgi:acetolactate synthase small subunit
MVIQVSTVRRLHVLAERDPGVLLRVLERFANLNFIPDRLNAICGPGDEIRIEIELTGVPPATCALITAKIAQLPAVLDAALDL